MRYISSNAIRENMILGKTLYDTTGRILLKQGTSLTTKFIDSIKRLNYPGIFIQDKFSENVEIPDIISDKLRFEAVDKAKGIFAMTNANFDITTSKKMSRAINETKELIEKLIDTIFKNRNILTNINLIKLFDDYIYQHSVNVVILSLIVGTGMNYNAKTLESLGLAAFFHDIGKTMLDRKLLDKRDPVTKQEFEILRGHATKGYEFIKSHCDLSAEVSLSVLQHHERYDGSGYPNEKSGSNILPFARILAICDVYDAITSNRPYRGALMPSEAIEYIMANTGVLFDPEVAGVFLRKVAPYPIGVTVKLSNGLKGIVMQNYEDLIMRPKLRILGGDPNKEIALDLKNDSIAKSMTIIDIDREA